MAKPYHCVYRIVCTFTGKVYVGKTKQPPVRRKGHHFNSLRQGIHHSAKLQRAYNKYGSRTFYFEVLENNLTEVGAELRESFWVSYFDSFHNGYNMTPGGEPFGDGNSKACIWNGIKYTSIIDAARSNNVHRSTMEKRIQKKYNCDDDLSRFDGVPIIWDGVKYSSKKRAARILGISRSTLNQRVDNGYTYDSDVPLQRRPCIWNGIEYPSITNAAEANSISVQAMNYRLEKGYTCDEDMCFKRNKPVTWNGVVYATIEAAAKANGISYRRMVRRVRHGYICDSDM